MISKASDYRLPEALCMLLNIQIMSYFNFLKIISCFEILAKMPIIFRQFETNLKRHDYRKKNSVVQFTRCF